MRQRRSDRRLVALANYFAAGAYVAGVTQEEFDAAADVGALIQGEILSALQDPARHTLFESIMLDLTGGAREFDRDGFHMEEETNWRRAELAVIAGLAPNADTTYRLGIISGIDSNEFNRAAVRLPTNDELLRTFTEGEDTTGNSRYPSYPSTPRATARWQSSKRASSSDALTARGGAICSCSVFSAIRATAASTPRNGKAGLEALVAWVEHGEKPEGDIVLVDDLRALDGKFELMPRDGTPEADQVQGASERVTVRGSLTLNGEAFDATYLGAIVRNNGFVSPCQYTLPPVDNGRYEIVVFAEAETSGCGATGSEVFLWTFANEQKLYSSEAVAWPGNGGAATFDASFSTSTPEGGVPARTELAGEVYNRKGEHLPPGTRVEAYVGDTLCGVGSTRRTGSFIGFILSVVGPGSIPACELGATITFRIDGKPATETATNHLGPDSDDGYLDLTIE